MGEPAPARRLAGREIELARVREAVRRAEAGDPTTLLLTGPAGIGKTALSRSALAETGPGVRSLQVHCLPMQALSAGLAPLRAALRSSAAPAELTHACLTRMDAGDPVRAVDDWVEAAAQIAPLLVLVDDVQWAEDSLRDVVHFLAAGPSHRRMSMLVTARTGGLPDGHPLHRWLADVLRWPQVSRLEVGPLDRAATEDQLAILLGGRPHQSLVEDVFRASRGNPYLTSLLVATVSAPDRRLRRELAPDLVAAITGAWHGCTPSTRGLVCLLALAGEPQDADALQAVADDLGLSLGVPAALTEAEAAGLVERRGPRFWFRHPLQAEVLGRALPEVDTRRWQAAYARWGDRAAAAAGAITVETALVQATRHDRAGAAAEACRWAWRAWEVGGSGHGSPELLSVLRRAIALHPSVGDAVEPVSVLWQRVRALAAESGAVAEELEAVEALLALLDESKDPLAVSELVVRRMLLRLTAAGAYLSVGDAQRAVRLAEADPSSWQYALALAERAHVGAWYDDPAAPDVAARALASARAASEPRALSYALTASAIATLDRGDATAAAALATEAVDQAVLARDWWAYVHAVMWETNALPEPYGDAEVAQLRRRREQLTDLGGSHAFAAMLAATEAGLVLEMGDWRAGRRLLRETVAADPGPMADLRARSATARLDAYQGRVAEALSHVARIQELVGGQGRYRNLSLDVTRATALLAAGRPAEAYEVALSAAADPGAPVDMGERLLPLAARALADLTEQARSRRRSAQDHLDALADLRRRFPLVIDADRGRSSAWLARLRAMQAWYDAETGRARQEAEEPLQWAETRSACSTARLPWLEAYACWRAAEAFLRRRRDGRAAGLEHLRAGHELAGRLAALTLVSEFEDLARLAHVRLGPAQDEPVIPDDPRLASLTAREREMLARLAQGLTYAEIARALVISEKTVSSHISHLLRKTGTTNRVQLARLVSRRPG